MKKIILFLVASGVWVGLAVGVAGCKSDEKMDSNIISSGTSVSQDVQNENENLDKKSYAGLEDVFQDTKVITPNGKYMMIVFGANGCPYCEMLKKDIQNTPEMKNYIKDKFSAYYVNLSYSKMHDFKVGTPNDPKEVKISTSQLGQMYAARSTPTIVFSDDSGKTIFELPGYMPQKQFMAILEFIGDGNWKKAKNQNEIKSMLNDFILKKSNS